MRPVEYIMPIMCGRMATPPIKKIIESYGIEDKQLPLFTENYNAAPTQMIPLVTMDHERASHIEIMKWGFKPPYDAPFRPINATKEKITSSTYLQALKTKRAIVPVTGFYEWKKTDDGKVPYFIHLKNEDLFSVACVYSYENDKPTFAIITCEPNTLMQDIHNRMPVGISKNNIKFWLDPSIDDATVLQDLLTPYPESEMEAYIVSSEVNKVKNNSPDLINRMSS